MLLLALVLPYIPYVSEPFSPARRVEAADTITVTTTSDANAIDGACSLREAILATNSNTTVNECSHNGTTGDPDTINFNIVGSAPFTIIATTALPNITDQVVINGRSQPGWVSAPIIVLNGDTIGGSTTNGLFLAGGSSGSIIQGLVIQGFPNSGIRIESNSNTVRGNYIGTNAAGTAADGNRGLNDGAGVEIVGVTGNTVGGTSGLLVGNNCTGDCNLVSGNGETFGYVGVKIRDEADSNTVVGNFIGSNAAGTSAIGNGRIGLQIINSDDNIIGGASIAERNVISGNDETGLVIISYGAGDGVASGNIIRNNYVGLNSAGTGAIPGEIIDWGALGEAWNYSDGMRIRNSPGNTITGNYVSGLYGTAIRLQSYGFLVLTSGSINNDDMTVTNNFIGTNGSGTGSLGNGEHGIFLQGASDSLIQGNVVNNNLRGIVVDHEYYDLGGPIAFIPSLNNRILQNTTSNNTNLGIDIVQRPVQSVPTFGVTANDANDADTGNNDQQNFPVLTSANVVSGPSLTVSGNLTTIAGTYQLEFFSSPSCDSSGNGEGAVYLGSSSLVVASTGVAQPFTVTGLPSVTLGNVITTTATSNNGAAGGETSEYSGCATVTSALPTVSINDPGAVLEGTGPGSTTITYTVTLSAASGSLVTVPFSIGGTASGGGIDYTFLPVSPLSFSPGDTSENIVVTVNRDALDELDETVVVTLGSPVGANPDPNPANTIGDGTITDDDNPPTVSINDVTANEADGTMTFTITLSAASGLNIDVPFTASDVTATAADYVVTTGSPLIFAAGDTSETINVTINPDALDEDDETFNIQLGAPTNATLDPTPANTLGVGTITDDDPLPTVSIDDVTVDEADGTLNFTVSLSAASGRTVTVQFADVAGTATTPADYSVVDGTVTFVPGDTSETVSATIVNDALDEDDETFTVTLSAPSNATLGDSSGLGTITDNDPLPTVSIDDVTVDEADGTLNFTVSLSAASGRTVTVQFADVAGTATTPADYSVVDGTVTFVPGDTSETIAVTIVNDALDENNETFNMTLSAPSNATIADGTGVGTITDNDPLPTVSIDDVTVGEAAGTLNFTVSLSAPSGRTVTVQFADVAGTATTPADYNVVDGTVTFVPGDTSETVSATIVNDTTDEPDETFTVTLSSPTNATLGDSSGLGTITDNDDPPIISITDVALAEGTGGAPTAMNFTVSLSAASAFTVSTEFTVTDGSAVSPTDYTVSTVSPVTINPGSTSVQVQALIVQDNIDEPTETFTITLVNPTNATLNSDPNAIVGVGTILDDDPTPVVSINDVAVTEGTGGTTTLNLTVSLTNPSSQNVSVTFTSANGSATGADYSVTTISPLVINAGTTTGTIAVDIVTDALDENNEAFTVTLTGATNATLDPDLPDITGVGTINDDDAPPVASIDDVSVTEGTGGTTTLNFTVTLTAISGLNASVQFAAADVTATGADYSVTTISPIVILAGSTTGTIAVDIVTDALDEPNETFTVTLTGATNATLDPDLPDITGVGTINDDDATPTVSINDVAVTEGTGAGTTTLTYTVTLSAASGFTVSVPFTAADVTATDPADYSVTTISPLTFNPGVLTQNIAVDIVRDATDEPNETFTVTLGVPTNATVDVTPGAGVGIGTINNDDGPPLVSIDDVSANEGTGTLNFTVTLSASSGLTVTVPYTVANGTATSPADYTLANGSVTFIAGDTSETISATLINDLLDEDDETFTVTLGVPTNAVIDPTPGAGVGIGTIVDNDALPTVSIDDVTVDEANGTLNFTVTLSPVSGRTVTVPYTVANGTATSPADYTLANGSVTFVAGDTSETITATIINDLLDENDEDFTVTLGVPTNATVDVTPGAGVGVGTITDNDALPTVSIDDVTVDEAAGTLNFTVTLSPVSGRTVTVPYTVANGSATSPADYTLANGSVTFVAGDTSETISATIINDLLDENDEDFTVTLGVPTNATVDGTPGAGVGVGTITDNDNPPTVSINDVSALESAGTLNFTVTLSTASGLTVTVPYTVANGSATSPADYTLANGSVTFVAGDTSETITATIINDLLDEDDETFTVTLGVPTNATVDVTPGAGVGVGTITDNDALPTVSINDVTVDEGNGTLTYTVTLSPVSGRTVTVPYIQAPGTATTPADYSVANGSVTFIAGDTSETITVTIVDDTTDEPTENFTVTLQTPTNADLDGVVANTIGVGTITDNDNPPTVSINDVAVTEGTGAGTTTLTYTVTLSQASGFIVSVPFTAADVTATDPADYSVTTISPLTFNPGVLTQNIAVDIVRDATDEPNETFTVTLGVPTNATVDVTPGAGVGIGTINNDDGPPLVSIDDVSANEGTGTLNFTVTLSASSGLTVTVPYTVANGTATSPADYTLANGSVTFIAGDTSETISATLINDLLDEDDETFTVTLGVPTNAVIDPTPGAGVGIGTIVDNDALPTVSIDDVTVDEANGTLNFTVTLSPVSGRTVTVPYTVANGTATSPADYTLANGSVTFVAGDTSETITATIINDLLDENDEDFTVTLGVPTNATVDVTPGAGVGVGTITDNDALPTVSIDDVTVDEANGTLNFTVTLSPVSGRTVTVPYTVANGSATSPADYTLANGSVTFVAGDTSETISATIINDLLDENSEDFTVTLGVPTNATVDGTPGAGIGVGTITDNDNPPTVSINDVSALESAGTLNFTVTLSTASGLTVTVPYTVANGSATSPADYTLANGSVTFVAGDTSETITATIINDLLDEDDETFTVTLGVPTNATVDVTPGAGIGVGTITDNDALPTVSIDDVTVDEGNGTLTYTVTLSPVSGRTVTVPYIQAPGTATTPADYSVANGSVTFVAGDTSETITVTIVDDTTDEPTENFTVTLQTPTNADLDPVVASTIGVGTITDNDNPPTVSINDVAVTEGTGAGTTTLTYTVTLSQASGFIVSVPFTAADVTATDPADYSVTTISPLTFNPGVLTQNIAVDIVRDATDEPNETFTVTLGVPTNATVDVTPGAGVGIGTINNDDGPPLVSITDVTADEGAGTLTFTVSLTAASGLTVTVPFTSAAGTALTPADYSMVTISPLTFTPGDTSETITVNIVNDLLDENDETFTVTLGTPTNADLDPTPGNEIGTGTITDNDNPPSVSIDDVAVTEGTGAGTTTLTFTATLSAPSGLTITVPFTSANGTAGGADYSVTTVSPLTFNAGVTTQTISVNIVRDALDENNEDFTVTLGAPTNATLDAVVANTIGVGTINDDDNPPSVSIDDVAVTEGTGAGTTTLTFTATLSAPSGLTITVPFTAADVTATVADYSVTTVSPLTFNAGVTTQTISVNIVRDATDEPNETFEVTLGAPTNATLDGIVANTIGVGTINDDDAAPTVSIDDVAVVEGTGGTTTLTFTATLSAASGLTVTVPFTSANGTATGADYSVTTVSPLTFNVGVTTQTIAVDIVTDNIDENNETFTVTLGAPTNATLDPTPGAGVGIGTINDDDNAPVVSINDVTVTEGTGGTNTLTFTVSLTNPSSFTVTVPFTSANGTAVGTDYSVTTISPLTFNAGVTSQSISVNIVTDAIDENNEDFTVTLGAPTNATLDLTPANTIGVGTINDDDAPPTVSIDDVAVTEGTGVGTTNLTFTVTLSAASDFPITVPFTVADVTAVNPADYSVTTISPLNFAAGTTTHTIVVSVVRDGVDENNETFNVTLGAPTNATLDPTPANTVGVGTINDDDTVGVTVTITGANTTVVESPAPSAAQRDTFDVRLASEPSANTTINLTVSDGQTLIGRVGGPYGTSLNLTFVPSGTPTAPNTLWDVAQTVEVVAVDDALVEPAIHNGAINFAVQAGSAAEYVGLIIPALSVRIQDNDGPEALAIFNPQTSQASLLNTLQDLPPSGAYNTFAPGAPLPGQWVMGDWDGDGQKTPGVYASGAFFYTNLVGPVPPASWVGIWFGLPGPAVPGRFDAGVGHDCIGVVDSGNFPPYGTAYVLYYTCNLTSGPTPPLSFQWLSVVLPDSQGFTGTAQFTAGDWDGDGTDSIAIRRSEFIAYTNVPPAPNAPSLPYSLATFNLAQYIGDPRTLAGDVLSGQYGNMVSGDWDSDGIDSFGLYYPAGYFYYRNDLLWNSGVYTLQRVAQPIGTTTVATSWRAGVSGGAMVAQGQGEAVESTPTPSAPTTRRITTVIESDDAQVVREGKWTVQTAPLASGDRYVYGSGSTDDILTLEFVGTSVEVIYVESRMTGTFTIVVDDVAVRTVITTGDATEFNSRTLINYLSDGQHTLQIVPISGTVAVDAFVVTQETTE